MTWEENAVAFRMSREEAIFHGIVEPTPEEWAKIQGESRRFHEEQRAKRVEWLAALDLLSERADPLARKVLDLHSDEDDGCGGCDFGGYDGEAGEWPCRTVRLIAEHLDVTLPDGWLPSDRYEGEWRPSEWSPRRDDG